MNWTPVLRILRTPWGVIPLLVLLITGLSALWFFHNFERKEFEYRKDISPAARKNPLLAAQKYLQATGLSAHSLEGMDLYTNLPSSGDAIIIRHLPQGLSQSINENLISWVESGGHLLVVPNTLERNKTYNANILEQLGVQYVEEPEDPDCGCPRTEDDESDSAESDADPAGVPADTAETEPDEPLEEISDAEHSVEEAYEEEPDEEEYRYRPYDSLIDLTVDGYPVQIEIYDSTLLEDKDLPASYRIKGRCESWLSISIQSIIEGTRP